MAPPSYGALEEAGQPSKSQQQRMRGLAVAAFASSLFAAAILCTIPFASRVELTGVIGNDGGPSSRYEGTNAPYGMARNPKEEEYGFGKPGWEPGPDYYSTERWDNAEVYPSLMHSAYDPYVGKGGCPTCAPKTVQTFMFSVTPICDGGIEVRNIQKILQLDEWWRHPDFGPSRYKEYHWIGSQVAYFIGAHSDTIMVTPPCFFPPLANTELSILNAAIYNLGESILILGGLQGANFLSQNLAGTDGRGYVDEGGVGRAFSHKFDIDTVWSDGPFMLQNAATTTEFFYGPRALPGVASATVGIPVRDLPPETIHYYMSADEISVVFEIPAGAGRILFMGYDFSEMVPAWIDALLLARRELEIEILYPAGIDVGLETATGLKNKLAKGPELKPNPLDGNGPVQLHNSEAPAAAQRTSSSSPSDVSDSEAVAAAAADKEDHLLATLARKPAGRKDAVDEEIDAAVQRLEAKEEGAGGKRASGQGRQHLFGRKGARSQWAADAQDMTDRGSWEHSR